MPAQSLTCRRSSSRFASYPCIGRSASKLSRTKSGVVSAPCLAPAIACLPFATPIPPLALLHRQMWIPGLRDSRTKDIEAADVHRLLGNSAKLLVKFLRILPGELADAGNAEQLEIVQHGRSDRNQVLQFAFFQRHKFSLTTHLVSL